MCIRDSNAEGFVCGVLSGNTAILRTTDTGLTWTNIAVADTIGLLAIEIAGNKVYTCGAVSYTHLDVYKRQLEKRAELRANLHGRACADFDVIAENTSVPAELHPDNPIADDVFVVIHGAGAYSHYMERNFWCGITPPMKMNYYEFRNCITSEMNYQRALINSYSERSGLPLKNAMTFITHSADNKFGQIKGLSLIHI